MKKNILNRLILLCCLMLLFSCKAKKQLIVTRQPEVVKAKDENTKANKLNAIRLKQIDFNTFSGKAAAKLNIDGRVNDVTMNIRIKKGQQIWVSITAILGLEVARALITPDSIKVINRLEGSYLKKPFNYIYQFTSRQINYKTLESLLIGNAIPELINEQADIKANNGNVVLSGNLNDLAYTLVVGPDLRVTKTSMVNTAVSQSIQVENAGFIQTNSRIMPSQININSSVKEKKVQIDLHYIKTDFDQSLDFPFNVSGRFSIVN